MACAEDKATTKFRTGLCIEGEQGKEAVPILSSTTHVTLLADLCLQVTLKQKFKIPIVRYFESGVSYIFPLPAKAAVHKFEAKLQSGAVIKGIVKKKEEARAEFNDAVDQGFRALLMEQKDADVFKCNIGNFSNETCEVTMSFVMEVEVTPQDVAKGGIRFTLPQDIAPRYDATYSGAAAPYHIQIVLDAYCSSKITNLEVTENYQPFLKTNLNGSRATAIIDAVPNSFGNIVGLPGAVEFYLTQDTIPIVSAMVERCVDHQSEVLRVSFDEKFSKTMLERDGYVCPPLELSFLIDRSGSMSGLNMRMVKDAMAVFLRSLPSNCLLQLIEFQSSFSNCFKRGPKPYNQKTLDQAEQWVDRLEATGGTEIKNALASVLKRKLSTDFARHVIVLTDGDVGNVNAIVNMIKQHPDARVHTLGLGSSFSEGLCLKVAEAGNGSFEPSRNPNDLSSACIRLLRAVQIPKLTDMKFDLGKWDADNEAEIFPKDFQLRPGKRNNVYFVKGISAEGAKEKPEVEQFALAISAKAYTSETGMKSVDLCSIQANSSPIAIEGHKDVTKSLGLMLHRLMAKSRIDADDPDSINLGIKFNLASPGTSFIAVEYKEGKETETRDMGIFNKEEFESDSEDVFGGAMACASFACAGSWGDSDDDLCFDMEEDELLVNDCFEDCFEMEGSTSPEAYASVPSVGSSITSWVGNKLGSLFSGPRDAPDEPDISPDHEAAARPKKYKKEVKKQPAAALTFTQLIRCQKFDGRFIVDLDAFSAQKTLIEKLTDFGFSTPVLCTILALYVLHSQYSSQQDEWELVAEKAEAYLKTEKISNSILENISAPDLW